MTHVDFSIDAPPPPPGYAQSSTGAAVPRRPNVALALSDIDLAIADAQSRRLQTGGSGAVSAVGETARHRHDGGEDAWLESPRDGTRTITIGRSGGGGSRTTTALSTLVSPLNTMNSPRSEVAFDELVR